MKRSSAGMLVLLVLTSARAASAADPVQSLADDSYPRISQLATGIVVANWSERLDSLVTTAPTAAVAGGRWKAGDAHWEAAKRSLLAHVETWCEDLAADPMAKEIVAQKFARGLSVGQAASIQGSLASAATKGFPDMQDSIHLAVVFAGRHPELRIGAPEFSKAYASWLATTTLEVPAAKDTPELTALMNSEAGFAYGTARGSAIDSLATGLDGQVQLLFNDRQASLLQEIGNEAKACAAGHK